MDIEESRKLIKNKIESDDLVKKVRDVIKITKWEKQDAREGFRESFKPLIESQEKVSEDIKKQQKETLEKLEANQEALTQGLLANQLELTEGIKRLALTRGQSEEEFSTPPLSPTIEDKQKEIIDNLSSEEIKENLKPTNIKIDLEKEFNSKDIDILIGYDLIRPKNLISLSDNSLDELINKSNEEIKKLNALRAGLYRKKLTQNEREREVIKLDNLQELLIQYKINTINFKQARQGFQTGTGIYYNNPHQLIDRLELLIGSILAGNNGVIPEFLQIIHILNKNKWITKEQLNNLIKGISYGWVAPPPPQNPPARRI